MSRSVRVRVCRGEGGSGERQDHGTHAPHGQQGSAERRSPEHTDDKPGEVHGHCQTWKFWHGIVWFQFKATEGRLHDSLKHPLTMTGVLNIFPFDKEILLSSENSELSLKWFSYSWSQFPLPKLPSLSPVILLELVKQRDMLSGQYIT